MSTGSRFSSIDRLHFSTLCITFIISSMVSISAYSVSFESGDWSASVDTTATTGIGWRIEDRDTRIIGLSGDPILPGPFALPGTDASIIGTAFSENSDDDSVEITVDSVESDDVDVETAELYTE